MKTKSIICAAMTAFMMVGFASCSQQEDITPPQTLNPEKAEFDFSNCKTVSLNVGLPTNELRTRAEDLPEDGTPVRTIGEDGLYQFDRLINKLYYGVYQVDEDGNFSYLIYNSEETGAKQAVYDPTTNSFNLEFEIPSYLRTNQISLFLFAANEHDNVVVTQINERKDEVRLQYETRIYEYNEINEDLPIYIDFQNTNLYSHPGSINKDECQYDYFAKLINLIDVITDSTTDFGGSCQLIRPFCQINVLSDEFQKDYPWFGHERSWDLTIVPSLNIDDGTHEYYHIGKLPFIWNFFKDRIYLKEIDELGYNRFKFNPHIENIYCDDSLLTEYEKDILRPLNNEVLFNDRQMNCLVSFLMLAGGNFGDMADEIKNGGECSIVLDFDNDTNASMNKMFRIPFPSTGLQNNEKYVIYNKAADPEAGEGGGLGFISSNYLLEVSTNNAWNNSTEMEL